MKFLAAGLGLLGSLVTAMYIYASLMLCSCGPAPEYRVEQPPLIAFARSLSAPLFIMLLAAVLVSFVISIAFLFRRGPRLIKVQILAGAVLAVSLSLIILGRPFTTIDIAGTSRDTLVGTLPGLFVIGSAFLARRAKSGQPRAMSAPLTSKA